MNHSREDAPPGSVIAHVGLGSNLGDGPRIIQATLQAIGSLPHTRLLRTSRLYRTPAWGRTEQPDFTNAVAMIQTGMPAQALLAAMLEIERGAGRERGADRWGPRTLDLDLLLYGDAMIDEPGLRVPHPHLHERAFALLPLVEIAPSVLIPGVGPAHLALAGLAAVDIHALPCADPPAAA
ncbi:MAG: 2-amino-4-hydroxy-6-hydroxymethyldihydropteridine diphosphokinase [Pseudomonadota bacterium]|nr:2-amino-4-hydroxy-6-hydroxymethyldihydropteridine diphosphokinase [Pseudomonadota bacterium]